MTRPARVLVAEDEVHLGVLLQQFLLGRGHQVTLVHDGTAALAALEASPFDVALLDVQMPGADGLAVLHAARARALPPQVVVMTGNGTVDTALAAIRDGAYDYVAKPYRMAEVDLLVRRAAERRDLERQLAAHALGRTDDEWITSYAPLRATLARVDERDALGNALIIGEPGTGKSSLARRMARRRGVDAPLVEVDASRADDAALADAIALAQDGTLHVRRVERLSTAASQRLARDVGRATVVASTSFTRARLDETFASLRVDLPPLRERVGDVELLAEAFVRRYDGTGALSLGDDARRRLCAHHWPGNVTELQLVIDGAVAQAPDDIVTAADLRLDPTSRRSP